jgi:hypothetical protein
MRPLGLALLCAAIAVPAVALATGPSGGRSTTGAARVGVSYGALTPQGYALWVRLRRDRQRVASLEMGWEAPAARCSNRKTFYSSSYLGGENFELIPVKAGQFTKRAKDRYFDGTTAIVEDVRVQGRITPAATTGSFTATVNARRRDGTRYTCSVGPVAFRAVN